MIRYASKVTLRSVKARTLTAIILHNFRKAALHETKTFILKTLNVLINYCPLNKKEVSFVCTHLRRFI
jgi:hypothetical protein